MSKYEGSEKFPLSVELNKIRWKEPPAPKRKVSGGWRLVGGAILGLAAAFVVCLVQNSGNYFIPVFAGVTLLVWVGGIKGGED